MPTLLNLIAGSIASSAQLRLLSLETLDLLYLHAVQVGENLCSGDMKWSYGWVSFDSTLRRRRRRVLASFGSILALQVSCYLQLACSLVSFWADKPGWCWFVMREKYCIMADKPWLKPTSRGEAP